MTALDRAEYNEGDEALSHVISSLESRSDPGRVSFESKSNMVQYFVHPLPHTEATHVYVL